MRSSSAARSKGPEPGYADRWGSKPSPLQDTGDFPGRASAEADAVEHRLSPDDPGHASGGAPRDRSSTIGSRSSVPRAAVAVSHAST
jgi:hypothetical protein